MIKCSQINLLSKDGQVTSVPSQFLTASSTFLKSILVQSSSFCETSASISISLPSATSLTLKLLAQILCMGETQESGGLEMTLSNMKELQDVIGMLGLNVNLCPKFTKGTGPFENVVVKEEVLNPEDVIAPKELEGPRNCDKLISKKSTVAKMSSSSENFRQSKILKEFKKKMRNNLIGGNEDGEESVEKLDTDNSAHPSQKRADKALRRSSSRMLMQPGLLKEFEVKLVQSANKGTLKNSLSKEEKSFMCNTCGVMFSKYLSLKRHYREKHGIRDQMPGGEFVKPSVNKCPECDLKFRFRSSLLRHLKRVHNNESKQDVDLEHHKCGECDEIFSNFQNLQRHGKNHHSKISVKPVFQETSLNTSQDCGLVATSMKDMSQHCHEVHKRNKGCTESIEMEGLQQDKLIKRLKCRDCDKRFNRTADLRKHIERWHEGKTYGCGECNVIFSYRNNVVRHCVVKGHDKELIYMFVDLP